MRTHPFLCALFVLAHLSFPLATFSQNQALTNLPAVPHDRPVDFFFENEHPIQKDFVDFYDLRLVKRGSFSTKRMVAFLQEEAQKKGVDAVIELNKWTESTERTTLLDAVMSDGEGEIPTTTVYYTIIEGRGVKYVENIDLSKSVKVGKIYSNGNCIGHLSFFPNGEIDSSSAATKESKELIAQFKKFSESRLIHTKTGWRTYRNENGMISKRKRYRMNDWLLERVRIKYSNKYPDQIKWIKIAENPEEEVNITKITYHYDSNNRLVERRIEGAIDMKQRLIYKGGKLLNVQLVYEGKVYELNLEYYAQEDLMTLLQKVE